MRAHARVSHRRVTCLHSRASNRDAVRMTVLFRRVGCQIGIFYAHTLAIFSTPANLVFSPSLVVCLSFSHTLSLSLYLSWSVPLSVFQSRFKILSDFISLYFSLSLSEPVLILIQGGPHFSSSPPLPHLLFPPSLIIPLLLPCTLTFLLFPPSHRLPLIYKPPPSHPYTVAALFFLRLSCPLTLSLFPTGLCYLIFLRRSRCPSPLKL